ncbi:Formate/glycerate dehydrogenase catalytic domain-like protein [Metschnikowia bicuspidata]|uniref:Formate dehydrogenase n=1 Tax=Metschnikowia bicuspidata TaxID=27322 RepID=A0A4P9ZGT2_9ASCO|nr:Formate/glycerate dehydrogenase catalytic domain-like protein [Metschnikowia bicuspidata]
MSKPKVLLVLYEGKEHARQEPKLLGCIENELGIRNFVESYGYELVSTTSKDPIGDSEVDRHLADAEVIITTPFYPAYITKERIAKAPKLKICITAGVGSDHLDLNAANERRITVAEVTGSNVVSVAEHVMMTILDLVRNFVPAHKQAMSGGWDIAVVAKDIYDLEDKVVATVGCGRIGYRVLERLQDLPAAALEKINKASELFNGRGDLIQRVEKLEEMLSQADIVMINCPLHEGSKGLFNKEMISHMKDGAWLVNTARGAICNEQDVADAVNLGKLRGYGGDVWFPQPAPDSHPWRSFRNKYGGGNAMTPHVSGTSLDAQARYAAGVKELLRAYFEKTFDYAPQNLIVIDGDYATKAYGQRK